VNELDRKLEAARAHVTVEWTAERSRRVEQVIAARHGGGRLAGGGARAAMPRWAAAAAAVALVTLSIAATAGVVRLARGWQRHALRAIVAPSGEPPAPASAGKPATSQGVARVKPAVEPAMPSAEPSATAAPPWPAASATEPSSRARAADMSSPAPGRVQTPTDGPQANRGSAEAAASLRLAEAAQAPVPEGQWRRQADDGDFDTAFRSLQAAGATESVKDEPGDLLLAADVARLSGHPGAALAPLRQVLRVHRGDPRAALAAFTLGRVLLDQLGNPAEAADAFHDARALGAGGPLEEDALAREVEAASRAGDTDRARAAAEEYLRLYPAGRRVRAVRKFGGVE
jgi:transmembrane sensor